MSATDARPPAETEHTERAGVIVEPAPDPLLMLAADANDLVSRIHGGQGDDLNHLVQRAIAERSAAEPAPSDAQTQGRQAA